MFEGMLDQLLRSQSVPTFYGRVPEDQVLDKTEPETPFQADESYLTLKLASMRLENKRELWRSFVPFSVAIAEVLYDGKQTTFPFVVGNDLVQKTIEVQLGDHSIEPLNTTLAGPLPYCGGNVGLFLGLFRSTANDMSRGLFDTIGELASLDGVGQLAAVKPVAEVLQKGIYRIFDMKEVEFCFGRKDELDPSSSARNGLRSGYLAFINEPATALEGKSLWVENSILRIGAEAASSKFCSSDYCLLELAHTDSRGHYSDLECEAQWKQVQELILSEQVEKAELFLFPELCKTIILSPELLEKDKTAALGLYKLKLETEIDRVNMIKGKVKAKATRGARSEGGRMNPEAMMQKAAYVAERSTRDPAVAGLLGDLATHRTEVLEDATKASASGDDQALDAQIIAVRNLRPGPSGNAQAFYDALMADVVDTYTRAA